MSSIRTLCTERAERPKRSGAPPPPPPGEPPMTFAEFLRRRALTAFGSVFVLYILFAPREEPPISIPYDFPEKK